MLDTTKRYKHYRNKKLYVIEQFCNIQMNDIWISAVLYYCIDESEKKYVRSMREFKAKFEVINDETH